MQEDDPAEKEEKKEDPVEEYPAAGEQMKEGPANKPVEDPQVVPAALPAGVIDPTEAYKTRISKELEQLKASHKELKASQKYKPLEVPQKPKPPKPEEKGATELTYKERKKYQEELAKYEADKRAFKQQSALFEQQRQRVEESKSKKLKLTETLKTVEEQEKYAKEYPAKAAAEFKKRQEEEAAKTKARIESMEKQRKDMTAAEQARLDEYMKSAEYKAYEEEIKARNEGKGPAQPRLYASSEQIANTPGFEAKSRAESDKPPAPGGWVIPHSDAFDIIQNNPELLAKLNPPRRKAPFTPALKAPGALTKDVAHESTGSGKPSETSTMPVPEFKNYMRQDGRFVSNGFDIETIAKINEEEGQKQLAFEFN